MELQRLDSIVFIAALQSAGPSDRHLIESSAALQSFTRLEDQIGVTFRHIRMLVQVFSSESRMPPTLLMFTGCRPFHTAPSPMAAIHSEWGPTNGSNFLAMQCFSSLLHATSTRITPTNLKAI